MNILKLYSVYDEKASCYGNPFSSVSDGVAMREFGDAVSNTSNRNPLNEHASDFVLYAVGTFDERSGELVSEIPRFLVRGSDFIELD